MLKKILFIFCSFFLIQASWAQSGKIVYKVLADEKMMQEILGNEKFSSELKEYLRMSFANQIRSIPHIEYELEFNSKESQFKRTESMATDAGLDLNSTAGGIGINGKYFHFLEEDTSYHQINEMGEDLIITNKISDLNWEISNETKMIQGYQCYKATMEFTPDMGLSTSITAWFTKELPFQIGPAFYAGLPGVILEIKHGYYTFYANSISLSKREYNIRKPTKGELLKISDFKEKHKKMKERVIRSSQ